MASLAHLEIGRRVIVAASGASVGFLGAGLAYLFQPALPLLLLFGCIFAVVIAVRPMVALYAALLSVPFELLALDLGPASLSATEMMLSAVGIGWATIRLTQGHLPLSRSPLSLPLTSLIIAIVPGLVVAVQPSATLKVLVMWTSFLFLYEMIVTEAGPKDARDILLVLAASAGLVGLVAIVEANGSLPQLQGSGDTATGRASGALGHPNTLATLAALALPGAVALSLHAPPLIRPTAMLSLLCTLGGLALSLSRGGLLAVTGALVTMLAWPPFRRLALVTALLLTPFAVQGWNPLGDTESAATLEQRVSSITYSAEGRDPRFRVWTTTSRMIADHPVLGLGAGNYSFVAQRYGLLGPASQSRFEHAHNIPLTFAVEAGVLGLIALTWVVVALTLVIVNGLRHGPAAHRGLLIATAAAFVALAVQGMVDYTLRSNVIVAIIFALAACTTVLARPQTPQAHDTPPAY